MSIAVCVPTHNEPQEQVKATIAKIEQAVGHGCQISVFNDAEGRGKGYALRMALRPAKANYYIFIDGDGDIDPKYINTVLTKLVYCRMYDVVVGKKQLPHRWDRKILTFLSRIWIWVLFGIKVDTQTGIKGFNYKPEWIANGWAFDIEVLWKAKKEGKRMYQVPVHATVSSGKSFWDIVNTLIDTIKIRWDL